MFILALLLLGGTAYAKTQTLDSVSVSLKSVKENGAGTPYACYISSSWNTEIDSIEASVPIDQRYPGQAVTFTVVVRPREGYRFNAKAKVSASGGKLASKTVKASRVTTKINYTVHAQLEPVESAWFEDDYILKWTKVERASNYEVRLEGAYYKTLQASGTRIDLSRYLTDENDGLRIYIRAVPKSSQSWLDPGDWMQVDDAGYAVGDNTVSGVFSGNGNYVRFVENDGGSDRWYASGWQFINGAWYYFDPQTGFAKTGWLYYADSWYYFDPQTQEMSTGWICLNGYWFWLDPSSGKMLTGWVQTAPMGPWYYLDPVSGAMWHDTYTPDGYYVGSDGAWVP